MSRYSVEFGRYALRHLDELWDYVAERNSAQVADGLILAILSYCNDLTNFPHRGRARDDIYPGLRIYGYRRRAIVACVISDTVVEVHGVYWGGRDFEALLQAQFADDE